MSTWIDVIIDDYVNMDNRNSMQETVSNSIQGTLNFLDYIGERNETQQGMNKYFFGLTHIKSL